MMDNMNPRFGVAMSEAQYAEEWGNNSWYFKESGSYDWMLEQLGSTNLVLEVGCGSGVSTGKIVSSGREVLSIEVNKDAINAADIYLSSLGYEVAILSLNDLMDWRPGNSKKINILCADIFDGRVIDAIPKSVFDAIICWMIGSYPNHISSVINKDYRYFDGGEMAFYRAKVQRRCYDIGTESLKVGGVVHVVDRVAMMSWNDKDELRSILAEMQSELAGNEYQIQKSDTMFKRLEMPFNTSKIQYVGRLEAINASVSALSSSKARRYKL